MSHTPAQTFKSDKGPKKKAKGRAKSKRKECSKTNKHTQPDSEKPNSKTENDTYLHRKCTATGPIMSSVPTELAVNHQITKLPTTCGGKNCDVDAVPIDLSTLPKPG